ncbi:hypothetical protein HOY82DRAFT_641573 [Tuber indicum]|nr:hypothetical protein HOY82DRAFT_641573 [Tuber indicum]
MRRQRSGDIPTRTFDAILATQPELRDGEELMDGGELREKAKKALTGVLSREELCVKQVRNKTFVGNGRGLHLAMETASIQEKFDKELGSQRKRIDSLEGEIASQKKEIALLGKKVASQKKEIALLGKKVASQKKEINRLKKETYWLRISSRGYLLVRDRFISKFKRDILKNRSKSDGRIIEKGNVAAHWGDFRVDSMLYTSRGLSGWPKKKKWPKRQDVDTFKALYGVGPELVSKIKHSGTINVLNAHARTVSLKSKRPTTEFYKAFKKIVELLERGSGDGGYPDKLEDAYKSFWKCNKQ